MMLMTTATSAETVHRTSVIALAGAAGRPRSVAQILAETLAVVEPAYRAAVNDLPPEIRHVAGYHIGWWEADGRAASACGKAVRPALVLACARAAGGGADHAATPSRPAVSAAVAVELVHDFSLLHDDVMDGDLTRRHRAAAWAVFGVGRAILVGDALLALAMDLLNGDPARVLSGALLELCRGQSADLTFEDRADVSVTECLTMAERKTGALLGAACQLGALAGGADSGVAELYGRFGRQLGVAFQLIDDLLGIWGDPAVTGKPAGSDLAARKKSLPVVAALTSSSRAAYLLARLYERDDAFDAAAIARAAELVGKAGGRAWALAEAGRRIDAARAALAEARPEPSAQSDLHILADLISRRDRSVAMEQTGAIGASPAATAAWLGPAAPAPGHPALRYLETAAAQHGGPVPLFGPFTVMERAWTLAWLLRSGLDPRIPAELDLDLAAALGPGGVRTAPGLPEDADTTAVTLYALALLGRPQPPAALRAFELPTHFCTWPGEDGDSVSTNAHVLEALGAYVAARPEAEPTYRSAIAKVSNWLCRQQQADGSWTDRWHISPYYATQCAVTALRQFGHAGASLSVARARRWVESTQREHGRWGIWAGTAEETAYAIQILAYTGGAAVPDQTIEFLSAAGGTAHPPLWLAKDPYCPTAIVEAAILAALRLSDSSAQPRSAAA
jgi:geranylgeranyl diphosphate synthase, type I